MATVTSNLRLVWRLGTTYTDADTAFNFLTPATDDDDPRQTADEDLDVGQAIADELLGAVVDGPITLPTFDPPADQEVGIFEQIYGDIYERIWIVPNLLTVQNPQLNVDIPFIIWSAYPVANTLNTITPTNATGLTLDFSAPVAYLPVEEKTVNIQIGATADPIIDASYFFDFTFGDGTLDFETTLFEWVKDIQDSPLIEFWDWATDIIDAYDSTEQRIRGRDQPRRVFQFEQFLNSDVERRTWYQRMYSYLDTSVVVGAWQYYTKILTASVVTDTKIWLTTSKSDFRDSDFIIVFRPSDESSFLLKAADSSAVDADGVNLASPLTQAIEVGDIVAPGYEALIKNKSGIRMTSVSGFHKADLTIQKERTTFARAGSTATITTFDGLNVLDHKPLVTRGSAPEIFDAGYDFFDNVQGQPIAKMRWLHVFVSGARQFFIPRRMDPEQMDYWRDFMDAAKGMQNSFLMPTWFADLVLDSTPVKGSLQISITGAVYATEYSIHDTYQRFVFTNPAGDIIYRKISVAVAQPGDTSLLTLADALPNTDAWGSGFTIGYLNRVRLGADRVKLTHGPANTLIDFSIRTCDQ